MSSTNPAPGPDRQRVESDLLEKVRAAEQAYREAASQNRAVVQQYSDLEPGHPDGAAARLRSAHAERAALHRYSQALKTFTALVIHGRWPGSKPDDQG
jgi:hypothetical protein